MAVDTETGTETGGNMTMANTNGLMDGVMNRSYIDEHDIVQRYLRRSLKEPELAQFEIYMLANPAIIDDIEQQKILNQLFREELPRANKHFASSRNVLHRFRHAIPLAACLMLGLYIGLNTRDRVASDAPAAVLDTVVLQDLRGASGAFNVALPAQAASAGQVQLPLKIDVGPQLEPLVTYSVFVRGEESDVVITREENRKASVDGWLELTVALPGASPASYQVEVVEFPRGDSRSYSLSLQ